MMRTISLPSLLGNHLLRPAVGRYLSRPAHSSKVVCPGTLRKFSISVARSADSKSENHSELNEFENYTPSTSTSTSQSPPDQSIPSVLPHNPHAPRRWVRRFAHPKQTSNVKTSSPYKVVLRRMKDSFTEKYLLFKSDENTREEYINFYGGLRLAKILEDLDDLAGIIAYKHCDDGSGQSPMDSSLMIVTASVDRIHLIKRPSPDSDIKLSGHVTYVGHSSMEITINMENVTSIALTESDNIPPSNFIDTKISDPILTAKFTMVARDPKTNKAVQVNPLLLESDNEKKLFQAGADLKARKKLLAEQSLQKSPPTSDERLIIHDLWLESKKYLDNRVQLPKGLVWTKDTGLESVVLTQPQDRNIHNFIFGGYLMKLGFELAYSTASIFCKSRPLFLAMDDIWFRKPVPIGSILSLKSCVVYSSTERERIGGKSVQIRVVADVIDPNTHDRDTTNIFHFTFTSSPCQLPSSTSTDSSNAEHWVLPPRIIPETYEESMSYLDGKRKWEVGLAMALEAQASSGTGCSVLEEW
ncbi:HotDog domain-containing protein [Paraphysoderma sedebokerense]|nr:HotDog domain-containing protein [Paraphysoderma sedebokerense]